MDKRLAKEIERLRLRVEALENSPWLHPKDVMSIYGISKATLYRWLKRGKFPRPAHGPIWKRSALPNENPLPQGKP